MKKLYLINHPNVFQGEEKLETNKNYFEGWYFKNSAQKLNISFIPGININNKEKTSFIQVITNDNSYYFSYNINDFYYSYKPFYIKVGNSYFSNDKVNISISKNNININGELTYKNISSLNKRLLSPNIMGPFSYLPFMECNHCILSMRHNIDGIIQINDNKYSLNNGIGYIEKDWGVSFPSSYIWAQGNNFEKTASFFLSIANIPFKAFHFTGFICVLKLNNHEFRFTTYNCSKIERYEVKDNNVNIILKRGLYKLKIASNCNNSSKLLAPKYGEMKTHISESINSVIQIILEKNNEVIFSDYSLNCGLEIVR